MIRLGAPPAQLSIPSRGVMKKCCSGNTRKHWLRSILLRSVAAIVVAPGAGTVTTSRSADFPPAQPWTNWATSYFANHAELRAAAATTSRFAALVVFAWLADAEHARAYHLDDARATVIKKLKDPESARFTDIRANGEAVCGMVNAKNAMGGYPDAHKFYYSIELKRALIEGGGDISTDPLDLYANGYAKFY